MPRPRETLFLARDPPRPQRGCGLPDGCLARGPKRPAGPRGSYVLGKRCRPAWQSQDAREERFHGEDAQAGDPNRWTQPRGREPRTHNWLVERLVFLDHPDDLTGPYAIRLDRRGPNVSRL